MIRVFIADDQLLIRQGIRTLLEMDAEIVIAGEAEDGAETIERVPGAEVDVLLLDVRMPKKSGIDVLRELSAIDSLPPTLVLTTFDDTAVVLDAIRSGARGFLLKDISYQQLMNAIRAIAAGGTVFQPAITQRLLRATSTIAERRDADRGADRPRAGSGPPHGGRLWNKEIAHALGTAEGTIKNQVSSILAKFGVRDRTRAVLKALEAGLL